MKNNIQILPGLKAKLSIIFIVRSNKIYNRVMLRGEDNRSNQQKSNFARAAHFFLHFFAVVLHDYNVKLPETP